MPEYRFEPAPRPSLLPRIIQDVRTFFRDPIGGVIRSWQDEIRVPRLPLPVTVNTDTGAVAIEGARDPATATAAYQLRAPRYIATRPGQQFVGGRVQPLLQEALRTGTVPAGLPAGYRAVAGAIAGLNPELTANMASAIIPPGGMASFIQQPAANRISMMRGGWRSGPTKRRKKRTKTAKKSTRRAKTSARRSGKRSRKLKFGSPAWQKKYKVGKYRK